MAGDPPAAQPPRRSNPAPTDEPEPVTRAEFEELRYRLMVLEATLRDHGITPPPPATARHRTAPNPLAPAPRPHWPPAYPQAAPPVPQPEPAPAPPAPAPAARDVEFTRVEPPRAPAPAPAPRVEALPPRPPPAPLTRGLGTPGPSAPSEGFSVERMLGQRWAPRVGAVLVFLAGVFFLGLAIQRGWIGPLSQLATAVAASAALLGWGAWLTRKKGYGAFPQILEATGACLLYLTAFMSHAIPYYREATGLTEVGGGILMALVALGTVGLALWRDSRLIVGLGYTLAFLTAGLGFGALPTLTIGYVAFLGASLAWLVARKRWVPEAAAGTVVTGLFFIGFTLQAARGGDPSPWLVPLFALAPFAAFVWLTLQPAPAPPPRPAATEPPAPWDAPTTATDEGLPLLPLVSVTTLAWGVLASLAPFLGHDPAGTGLTLLGWSLAAVSLAGVARRLDSPVGVGVAYGVVALVLYLLWPLFLWQGTTHETFAITASYAAGALVLLTVQAAVPAVRASFGLFMGAILLTGAAAVRAIFVDHVRLIAGPTPSDPVGPWQAWVTLLLVGLCFTGLLTSRVAGTRPGTRSVTLVGAAAFLGVFAFAVVHLPLYLTLYWVLLAGVLMAVPLVWARYGERTEDATALEDTALTTALAVLGVAALRALLMDGYLALAPGSAAPFEGPVGPWQAWVTLLIIGAGFAALVASPGAKARPTIQQAAFATGAAFLALFAFAVVNTPLLYTLYWVTLGGALLALPLALRRRAGEGATALEQTALAASVIVLGLAVYRAVLVENYLVLNPGPDAPLAGPWEAWLTLALVAGALSFYVASPASRRHPFLQNVAFILGVLFVGLWGFALFFTAFLTTLYLVVAGGLLLLAPLLLPAREGSEGARSDLGTIALVASLILIGAASIKSASYDAHYADPRLPPLLAGFEALLVAGGLLALYHLALARRLPLAATPDQFGVPLVGGSALVLASFVFAYGSGPWTSVLLGALGVAYLGAGFVMSTRAVYRYTGFAVLGLVLVRVFAVDLGQTDLALRAIVFAVLGAILLGVGYAYARLNRDQQQPPPPEAPLP